MTLCLLVSFGENTKEWGSGVVDFIKKLKGIPVVARDVREAFSGINFDDFMGLEGDKLSEFISNLGLSENAAKKFLQSVHDGDIVLQEGQSLIDGYAANLDTLSTGFQGAALGAKVLSGATKLLSLAGTMIAVTLVTTLLKKGVEWFKSNFKSFAELTAEAKSSYDEATKKLQTTNSQLADIESKISDIKARETLTFIEQGELQNLEDAKNNLLALQKIDKKNEDEEQEKLIAASKAEFESKEKHNNNFYDGSLQDIKDYGSWEILTDNILDGWYTIEGTIQACKELEEAVVNGEADSSLLVGPEKYLAAHKDDYDSYKNDILEEINSLQESIGNKFYRTGWYKELKEKLINAADFFGDTDILSSFVFSNESLSEAKDQIITYFKDGGTVSGVRQAIGYNLYTAIEKACSDIGLSIDDLLSMIFSDTQSDLNHDGLEEKLAKRAAKLADKLTPNESLQKGYAENILNNLSKLSTSEKEVFLSATEDIDAIKTLNDVWAKYRVKRYKDDRNGYIKKNKLPIVTGMGDMNLERQKQSANLAFQDLIEGLDDTDYQIAVQLHVDASMLPEEIETAIGQTKDQINSTALLSLNVFGSGDDGITFEKQLETYQTQYENLKKYYDQIKEDGYNSLGADDVTSITQLIPDFFSKVNDIVSETGVSTTEAANKVLLDEVENWNKTYTNWLESVGRKNNLDAGAKSFLDAQIAKANSSKDSFNSDSAEESKAALKKSIYDIIGVVNSETVHLPATVAKQYQVLTEYTQAFGDFQTDIWNKATDGINGATNAIAAYEAVLKEKTFSEWLQDDDFSSYKDDVINQIGQLSDMINRIQSGENIEASDLTELASSISELNGDTSLENLTTVRNLLVQSYQQTLNITGATKEWFSELQNVAVNGTQTVSDRFTDVSNQLSTLKDAYDQLWTFQLQGNDLDTSEFTSFLTNLLQQFPSLAAYTDGTINSVQELRNAILELYNTTPQDFIADMQELLNGDGLTDGAKEQILQLIDAIQGLDSIDASMDTTKAVIQDMRDEMQNLAELINIINTNGMHLDIDNAQEVFDMYPELLAAATLYADGSADLNEAQVNDFIKGREAEVQADGESRIQELENGKSVLVAKRQYAIAKRDAAVNALASENEADWETTYNEIQNTDSALTSALNANADQITSFNLASQAMQGDSDALNQLQGQTAKDASDNFASSFTNVSQNAATMSTSAQSSLRNIGLMAQSVATQIGSMMKGVVTGIGGVITSGGASFSGMGAAARNTASKKDGGSSSFWGKIKGMLDSGVSKAQEAIAAANHAVIQAKLQQIVNQATSEIADLDQAIAGYDKQIDMIKANGGISVPDYVSNLAKNLADKNNGSSSSPSSGSGSDGGSSSDPETFDWVEVALDRIEYKIGLLDKVSGNAYAKFEDRNKALVEQLEQVRKEIDLQTQAYQFYLLKAENVGLSDSWKEKVKSGDISIDEISDETLANQIKEYQDYYEKALDAYSKVIELGEDVADLYKQSFELVSTEYEGILSQFDAQKSRIEEYLDQAENRGRIISEEYYQDLIDIEKSNISEMSAELEKLQAALKNGVDSGAIQEGSEEWVSMRDKINDVNQSILEAKGSIIEYGNSIRQLNWDVFDKIQDKISQITQESDFLIDLMSNGDLFDDKGKITDTGMATMGLRGVNYNTYMEQANRYAEEMKKLDKEIADDPYNQDLIDRREELLKLQQESIKSAEDEKQAIKSLIEDGIKKELESLQDLIDKYTDALDTQKDLYDYQKNVKEQRETIASLQKQLLAYSNDDSEAGKLKQQQLASSLKDAQNNLEETQYERYISDQKKLLDDLYTEYETTLNERLDNLDALIADCIDTINANSGSISETLTSVSENVGYTLTDKMETIWGKDGISGVITTYTDTFSSVMTGVQEAIKSIDAKIEEMLNASKEEAKSNIKEAESTVPTSTPSSPSTPSSTPSNSSPSTSTPSSSSSSSAKGSGNSVPEVGDVVTYTGSYMFSSRGANPSGSEKSGVPNAVVIDRIQPDSRWWHPTHPYHIRPASNPNGDYGWVSLSQISGYKDGTTGLARNQIIRMNEEGQELLLRDGSVLTPGRQGDKILTNEATARMFNFASDPMSFMQDLFSAQKSALGNISGGNTQVTNEIAMNISLPSVTNPTEFMRELQRNNQFERMIGMMIDTKLTGKNSLNKYSVKF